MAGSKAKKLPAFKSVNELVDFFDAHDLGDYLDQTPEIEITIKSKDTNVRARSIRNTGKPWTATQLQQLRQLAGKHTSPRIIGLKLGRTESAVRTQASKKGVSLSAKIQTSRLRAKK